MKPKFKNIDYGLAFTVCEGEKPLYIEVNKNLKKYPSLRKKVINHEMLHWNSKSKWANFKIDLLDMFNLKTQKELFKFQLKHPKAFLSNSPVFFEKGKILPNYFLIGTYLISIVVITTGVSLIL